MTSEEINLLALAYTSVTSVPELFRDIDLSISVYPRGFSQSVLQLLVEAFSVIINIFVVRPVVLYV